MGKNRDLKTLQNNKSVLCINLHTCLANKESLNLFMSQKPKPPLFFDWHDLDQLIQWIYFWFDPYPHQNFWIRTSISLHKVTGSLKQLMEYPGIAWTTTLIKISLLYWDNNLCCQPCDFFQILSFSWEKLSLLERAAKDGRPQVSLIPFIFGTPDNSISSDWMEGGVDLLKKRVVLSLLICWHEAASYKWRMRRIASHSSLFALQNKRYSFPSPLLKIIISKQREEVIIPLPSPLLPL